MIASIATYPHEVLRTRLQIQKQQRLAKASPAPTSAAAPAPFEGVVKTYHRILREEGLAGFYRGLGVNLLRTVPASALTILTYELIFRHLHRWGEQAEDEAKREYDAARKRRRDD